MTKYKVEVVEHFSVYQTIEVEAETEYAAREEAKQIAGYKDIEYSDFEYADTQVIEFEEIKDENI